MSLDLHFSALLEGAEDIFGKINPTPIALLFGLMLVNAYLQDTGLWKHVVPRGPSDGP